MSSSSSKRPSSTIDSPSENQHLSISHFNKLLAAHAKHKQRSEETSRGLHVSVLGTMPRPSPVSIALLGDSMFERFKTTGKCSNLEPWPSTELLTAGQLHRMKVANPLVHRRLDGVFNLGVGGDALSNIIYRLRGDPEKDLIGLLPTLSAHNIKLFVVHAGTNSLHPKRGLCEEDVARMRLILQAILRIARAGTKILVTGLFYRNDIEDWHVDKANDFIQELVERMNENVRAQRFVYFAPAPNVTKQHLVDHVHLNLDGYRVWMDALVPKMAELVREVDLLGRAGSAIHDDRRTSFKSSLNTVAKEII